MYQAKIKDRTLEVINEDGNINIDGDGFTWDISETSDNKFHIIKDNQAYNAEILSINKDEKLVTLKLNGKKLEVKLKDKLDLLLEKLGMDNLAAAQVNDVKAPMPGLIFEISIKEGDEVKKGDPIMILEAMKMENVLKSPGDGIVKTIKVKKGDSVEKNQVLVEF